MDYEKQFHNLVLGGKGVFVFLLLILSFINGHKDFVEKNPRGFIAGAFFFALAGAIAGAGLAWNRGGDVASTMFITTLFFFFFAVCREFSGYYALLSKSNMTQVEAKERKVLMGIAIAIGVPAFLYALYLVFNARVSPVPGMTWSAFGIETFLFVTVCALAEYALEFYHEKDEKQSAGSVASSVTMAVMMYLVGHLMFQYGGFYDHAFAPANWNNFKTA